MEEDDTIGESKFKWIKVQYNHMPKYCKEYCLQGHDKSNYWIIHPKLYNEKKGKEDTKRGGCKKRQQAARSKSKSKSKKRTLISIIKMNRWLELRINTFGTSLAKL